jgi:hypothetical protein
VGGLRALHAAVRRSFALRAVRAGEVRGKLIASVEDENGRGARKEVGPVPRIVGDPAAPIGGIPAQAGLHLSEEASNE